VQPETFGNLSGRAAHQRRMRLFYLVLTTLLFVSLGLLEVVAARSVPMAPLAPPAP
jgi:hypothetical protein